MREWSKSERESGTPISIYKLMRSAVVRLHCAQCTLIAGRALGRPFEKELVAVGRAF